MESAERRTETHCSHKGALQLYSTWTKKKNQEKKLKSKVDEGGRLNNIWNIVIILAKRTSIHNWIVMDFAFQKKQAKQTLNIIIVTASVCLFYFCR